MVKVEVLEPFETKAHRVIGKKKGEVINMPDEDYEEVKSKVKVLKGERNKMIKTYEDKGVKNDG